MNSQIVSAKLSTLSPDTRAEVEGWLEERERRKRQERSRKFKPTSPTQITEFDLPANDQEAFFNSDADERWIFGGNRSGKTEAGVQDCDKFCRGVHPVRSKHRKPPVKVRYCAPKWRDSVEGVILMKFQEVVQRHLLRGGSWRTAWSEKTHKLHYKNGSWIQFKSGEEDKDTYGGVDLDAVYQDEHLREPLYTENRARLTDRDGYFVSTMTPEEGITWEEDHVTEPDDDLTIDHWFFDIRSNPHLTKAGVEKFIGGLKGSTLYETKVSGAFCALSGLVLPQWNPDIHIVPDQEIPHHWPRVVCIDMHTRTPSALMAAAWDHDGNLWVYKTAKKFLTVPEWQQYILSTFAGEHISLWMLDEPGAGQGLDANNQESFVNQFNKGDNPVPFHLVKKDSDNFFSSGIYKLWEMLTPDPLTPMRSRIRVLKSCDYATERINGKVCGSLPWEIKKYQYKKEQKADEETLREKVRKVNDHLIDDLRYIVMAGPQGQKSNIKSAIGDNW
jgi:hypothetical protein